MYGDSILARRTVGAFPLSIGTSLAFESIFIGMQEAYDPQREIPNKVNANAYDVFYINLATLFRNMRGAVNKDDLVGITEHDYHEALSTEVDIIRRIISEQSAGFCTPVFYYCDYKTPYTKSHKAIMLRQDTTDGQKIMTQRLVKTMKLFLDEHKGEPDVFAWDDEIKPNGIKPKALILTHTPHDLLSVHNMRTLDLIESHSGKLKPRHLWYTKFFDLPGGDLATIPFNRKFLLVFGDSVMYKPMDIRFRREIVEISKKQRWTAFTTMEKVKMDLGLFLKEKFMFDLFKEL